MKMVHAEKQTGSCCSACDVAELFLNREESLVPCGAMQMPAVSPSLGQGTGMALLGKGAWVAEIRAALWLREREGAGTAPGWACLSTSAPGTCSVPAELKSGPDVAILSRSSRPQG